MSRRFELEYYKLKEENFMSNLFKLDYKDVLNGLLTSIFGAVITYLYGVFFALYQSAMNGQPFQILIDLRTMLVIGGFAGLSYLMKRFVSDKTGTVLGDN